MITKTYYPFLIAVVLFSFTACKSKKLVTKPQEPAPVATAPAPAETKPVEQAPPAPEPAPAPAPKPSLKFSNIQFEFNSGVLRTDAYPILDQAAAAMKQVPDAKFYLNGHSSAEGSAEHNQQLSEERANSVKTYLVNAGVNGANLTTKGYGESQPATTNKTEEGRALNRRVEIKLAQ